MQKEEVILRSILKQLQQICKSSGVRLFLLGDELLFAAIGKRAFSCIGHVCMTFEGFMAVRKELDSLTGLELESVYNNTCMPGVYYRLVNRDTLLIEPEFFQVRKCHGIAVNIHILRKSDDKANELLDFEDILENGIKGIKRKTLPIIQKKVHTKIKENNYPKWIEQKLKSSALKNFQEVSVLKIPGIGTMHFAPGYWEKTNTLSIEDTDFQVPEDPSCYLRQHYKKMYKKRFIRSSREMIKVICDSNIPYRLVINEISSNEIWSDTSFWKKRVRLQKNYFNEYIFLIQREHEIWNHLFLNESRFLLWKKYSGQKKNIKYLLKQERYDELYLLFADFTEMIKKHISYSSVPCFDKDLMEVYLTVQLKKGEEQWVASINECLDAFPLDDLTDELNPFFANSPEEEIKVRDFFEKE